MDTIKLSDTCALHMEHRFVNRNGLIHPLSNLQTCILEPLVRSPNEPVALADITALLTNRHLFVDKGSPVCIHLSAAHGD